MALDENLVAEIKDMIDLICIFQVRSQSLIDDFDFFRNELKLICPGLKRLEHEAMFLCIDMDALHKEILSESNSFYSKIILNHGRQLSKVDKDSTFDISNIRNFMEEDDYQLTLEQIEELALESNSDALKARKKLKAERGLPSQNHIEIHQVWHQSFLDETKEYVNRIEKMRDNFAHRKWKFPRRKEAYTVDLESISEILECTNEVLKIYKNRFQEMLGYANSESYESSSYSYDSLSRLKEAYKYLKKS